MNKAMISIFLATVSLLGGILLAGQLLGFFAGYYAWLAIVLSLLFTGGIGYFLFKKVFPKLLDLLQPKSEKTKHKILNTSGYVAGFLLLILLLVLPLVLWPQTNIYEELIYKLNWDAGAYHLPKAAELLIQHSAWDFSIAYGEYPWGFESLITFSLVLSSSGLLIGLTHALIVTLFAFSLFFLAARFSNLPRGLLFFGVVLVICSYDIISRSGANPWMVFRVLAFIVGKNDFFLAASILTLLVFSPIGPRAVHKNYSIEGMGIASALIIGTKPNGIPVVILVWVLAIVAELRQVRSERKPNKRDYLKWIFPIVCMLVGSLWAVRNLIGTGHLISAASLEIQSRSIVSTLVDPGLHQNLSKNFIFLLVVFFISIPFCIFYKKSHWTIPLVFFVLILSFAITPASVAFRYNQVTGDIDWRFGVYALAFEVVILLTLVDPLMDRLFAKKIIILEVLLGVAVLAVAGWGIYKNRGLLKTDPANTIALRDVYPYSVGVDGYYSAYDYVQKNVRNSVVWVENGMGFYVYGPGLTNSTTRSRPADYILFFQTDLINPGGYPDNLSSTEWQNEWKLIYEDGQGRVYQRR